MTLFNELHASGQTIVLVTHEADIAEHANREVVLRDGQIERDTAAADIAPLAQQEA